MDKKDLAVGIDLGATFTKVGLLDARGHIIVKAAFLSKEYASSGRPIDRLVFAAKDIMAPYFPRVSGIGIGVPGPVDYRKGVVHSLTNINGWKMVRLGDIMKARLGLPVYVDNDANAACAGEARWGAARGYDNAVCITLGSGVGSAVIIDGKIFRGRGYSAVEMGHICIDINGPKCNCGSNGCIETFVGNSYIVKDAVKDLKRGARSGLLKLARGRYSNITPELIDRAASSGDKFCLNVWRKAGERLGIGLAGIVNTFNPEIIVIGGGLSKAGRLLLDPVKNTVNRRAMSVFTKDLKIKRARFIEDAGIAGAASLVFSEERI
ncbi:MAG: ROK family protein [Candidatus Omnitrophica bacterium]|jgi:glucokinase|nr:ROK family protein [Candidatus Omnitrophota bacterium]